MKKFDNFTLHLQVLKKAHLEDLENEFIISGITDKFIIQFELGWKMLKELLLREGDAAGQTGSPREVLKAAYGYYDFLDEEIWLHMLQDRNNTAHIYDGNAAKRLVKTILNSYIPEFEKVQKAIKEKYKEEPDEI